MIKLAICDPLTSKAVRIGEEGEQYVVVHPHPPKDEFIHPLPYRQYMTDNGLSDGANDMRVDGSVTEQKFYVTPQTDGRDLYIGRLDITIADAGATLNQFGNIGALANGVKLEWVTQEFGTVEVNEAMKTNWDFVRLSGGKPAFGNGTTSFKANNVQGSSEGYFTSIDFDEIFNLRWGMRLRRGTEDKLVLTVRDDTTGVDKFDAVAYGITF